MSYYFISLGGSGAKTMESLIHLCISGHMHDRGTLNILSIDPDVGNGNLERTGAALNNYDVFQSLQVGTDTPLFKTNVSLIKPFPWNPTSHDKTLDDLMGYQIHSGTPLGSLYEVLYTTRERATSLNEGFRGHPSIGAAVMAKKYFLHDSPQWQAFIEKVRSDIGEGGNVKIFLAGSVFGGTGASGIPTIARLLRNGLKDKGASASIGCVLILPYFNFTAPENESRLFAKSENFLTNTKAALKYYSQRDNVFNDMYFIGDSQITPVKEFSPGASNQRNDAHIVDFYAALAALDFFSKPVDGHVAFKYICHNDDKKIMWNDFPEMGESNVKFSMNKRFVQFTRFIFAYIHMIKPVLRELDGGKLPVYKYPWYVDFFKDKDVDVNSSEVKNFEDYTEAFVTWLKQIETAQDREIALIKYAIFENNPARLTSPDEFNSCDGSVNKDMTLHEIWYKLSEPLEITSQADGFGRFLRRLYEACKV